MSTNEELINKIIIGRKNRNKKTNLYKIVYYIYFFLLFWAVQVGYFRLGSAPFVTEFKSGSVPVSIGKTVCECTCTS